MRVTGTERAAEVIEQVRKLRSGNLTFTIGTGCCESTAPFLYEDYAAGPDSEQVGTVDGVPVLAPESLRSLYRPDDELIIDVVDELAESFSVETELGVRFAFRSADQTAATLACEVPAAAPTATPTRQVAELPEHLRNVRIR